MIPARADALTDAYADAVRWALQAHRRQVRHNTHTPYLSHLLTTSALVLEEGADEEVAIAALLHDVLEDQPVGVERVREAFGERVAAIVEDCTDAVAADRPGMSWRDRKLAHLDRMRAFGHDSLLVVAADKVASLQSLVDDLHRFGPGLFAGGERTPDELLWSYEAVGRLLTERLGSTPLTLRLRALVAEARRAFAAQ